MGPYRNLPSRARRAIVLAPMYALAVGAYPKRVAAEPASMGALAVAAAVVSIVAGISGIASDQELRRRMKRVVRDLAAIVEVQVAILAELQALRFYIDAAAERAWRDSYAREIESLQHLLDTYIAELEASRWRISSRLRSDLEHLSRDAAEVTFNIGQMDPWAFPSFTSGIALMLITERILSSDKARVNEQKVALVKYVDRWLDEKNPMSIVEQIRLTDVEPEQSVEVSVVGTVKFH